MGWLDGLNQLFRVRSQATGSRGSRALRKARRIEARYDAAVLDDDNRRHWANADSLSARQANNAAVRQSLRDRARYEVANNCYARGMVNTLADIVVGYGPTLTLARDASASDAERAALRETADRFNRWAEEVGLWQKLWTMRVSRCQDGEAFGVLRTNPRLSAVELDLQLVEPEQVTDGYYAMESFDPKRVDGIDADDLGNPIRYYVLPEHPGDGAAYQQEPVAIRESLVCHWYRPERPGQLRGIPEITPALPLFAQLRRFTLATLTAAETAADIAAVIRSNVVPGEDEGQDEPFETYEIERGMWMTLPDGFDINQLKAEHPTTTYEMFKREILAEIGRVMQLPRMMTLLDASGYNYSSGRLDKQASDRAIEVEQYQCECVVLRKIWLAWLAEARLMTGYLPEAVESGAIEPMPRWLWRQLGHVDRSKEAAGATAELANHTTTLAEECARNGEDWEEVLKQRAAELSRMRELGLVPASAGGGAEQAEEGNGDGDAVDEAEQERERETVGQGA